MLENRSRELEVMKRNVENIRDLQKMLDQSKGEIARLDRFHLLRKLVTGLEPFSVTCNCSCKVQLQLLVLVELHLTSRILFVLGISSFNRFISLSCCIFSAVLSSFAKITTKTWQS